MKKLLLVLLVVTLASFLFVGCLPGVVADDDEDEDEPVVDEPVVTVEIGDSVLLDGKTYVKGGAHSITVTFAEPVAGSVSAVITDCGGNYKVTPVDTTVVLFPDADKKVWTGSGTFGLGADISSECCASYVQITSGECVDEVCIVFPVIVDLAKPFAQIKVTADECACDSQVVVHFDNTTTDPLCATAAECCGDDCSGLASWAIDVYLSDPFDVCCDIPCIEPIASCSGVGCAISCDTTCLATELSAFPPIGYPAADDLYFVVTTLLDEVGNKTRYYAKILLDDALVVDAKASTTAADVTTDEYDQNKMVGTSYVCSTFTSTAALDWAAVDYHYGSCNDDGDNIP